MNDGKIIIGSRGSDLALWQANYLMDKLKEIDCDAEIRVIKTKGDTIQNLSFDKIEGKGFFTKEIEDQLIAGEIDLAVHSMKDLPTTSPDGLMIAGTSYRENPSDTILIRKEFYDEKEPLKIKKNSRVGTSSSRRKAQLKDLNNEIETIDIRGNVPTRIQKLRDGQFDAIVLATAGLRRLDLDVSDLNAIELHPREFVPAPAQGVLAYQTRSEDLKMRKVVSKISVHDVATRTNVERRVLQLLDGGCHLPLGVYCEKDKLGNYHVWASYGKDSNSPLKRTKVSYSTSAGLSEEVFKQLLDEKN